MLIEHLPPGAAYFRALPDHPSAWDPVAHQIAMLRDEQEHRHWQVYGQQHSQPPTPHWRPGLGIDEHGRPLVKHGEQIGREPADMLRHMAEKQRRQQAETARLRAERRAQRAAQQPG